MFASQNSALVSSIPLCKSIYGIVPRKPQFYRLVIFLLNPKSKTCCQNGPSMSFYIYNIRYLVIFSARLPTVPFSPQLELRASLSNTLNTEGIQGFEWFSGSFLLVHEWINCFEWISSMNASVIKQWFATTYWWH